MKIRKTVAIILALACAFCLASCGELHINGVSVYGVYDAWNYSIGNFSYSAEEVSSVEINWIGGEINIIPAEAGTLFAAENSEALEEGAKMRYRIKEGKLTIHYCQSAYTKSISASSKHLNIQVPEGVNIDINNVSADVKFSDIMLGKVKIGNVSGDVNFASLACNELEIETVSGKITANEIISGEFSVNGVSGSIDVAKIAASKIDIDIVSGKTNLVLAKKCELDVSGVSGSVNVTFPADAGAIVKFSTVSGKLSSDLPHKSNKDIYTFGNGEMDIDIETVSGNLYIN